MQQCSFVYTPHSTTTLQILRPQNTHYQFAKSRCSGHYCKAHLVQNMARMLNRPSVRQTADGGAWFHYARQTSTLRLHGCRC